LLIAFLLPLPPVLGGRLFGEGERRGKKTSKNISGKSELLLLSRAVRLNRF
jgi:hypothetical protein